MIYSQNSSTVAYDVRIEPHLQPLTREALPAAANKEDEARLDIYVRGYWQPCEMAFFDTRVFSPFAKSHMTRNLDAVFKSNEASKKTAYNERIIRIEHGSFTPIVFRHMMEVEGKPVILSPR